jgi:hypothetical protein
VLCDALEIKHLMSGEHDVAHAGNLVAAGGWLMTYPWNCVALTRSFTTVQ